MKRPRGIKILTVALGIVAIILLVGLISDAWRAHALEHKANLVNLLIGLVEVALLVLLAAGLWTARNWARWTVLVISAAPVLYLAFHLVGLVVWISRPEIGLSPYALGSISGCIVLLLLCVVPSWYLFRNKGVGDFFASRRT